MVAVESGRHRRTALRERSGEAEESGAREETMNRTPDRGFLHVGCRHRRPWRCRETGGGGWNSGVCRRTFPVTVVVKKRPDRIPARLDDAVTAAHVLERARFGSGLDLLRTQLQTTPVTQGRIGAFARRRRHKDALTAHGSTSMRRGTAVNVCAL